MNKLFYGDNLTIMQGMPLHSVDLIYLDPPFKSDQNYNLVYKTMTGKPVPEQAQAFCDTWEMDAEKEHLAKTMPVLMREKGIDDYYVEFWRLWMNALRYTQPHLLAYLIYMVQRLLYMKTLLRSTGSIYLHCDPTASHYIKIMMDGIFGHQNFRNEIIWKRTSAHSSGRKYGAIHDVILFYSRSDKFTWNVQYGPYDKDYIEKEFRAEADSDRPVKYENLTGAGITKGRSGQPWRGVDPSASGRHWAIPSRILRQFCIDEKLSTQDKLEKLLAVGRIKINADGKPLMRGLKTYLDELPGMPLQDIWTDVLRVGNTAKVRLGYPTQKPVELLKRIIEASSRENAVVFDPFCGCGTTVYAAQETGRNWIGCDVAILAIKLIREILGERYRLVEGKHFTVDGIPVSVEQAEELFKHDPFQFQHWAVERIGGFPTQKKGADFGIDGRLYFETKDTLKSMIISVKGGHIRPTDIRDLRGVLEREEGAELAGFISLQEPTKAMREEAAKAGMYNYGNESYPRLQLLSIKEIVENKKEFKSPTKMGSRIATGQALLPL